MPLKLQILSTEGMKWVSWCKHRLAGLTNLRKQTKGSILKQTYALPDNIMAQVISWDVCDIIRIWGGGIAGFLCYPHSGDKTLATVFGALGAEFHRQIGSIAFPLVDDDGDTANVFFDGDWQAELDVDLENYGNIDWIGKSSTGEGQLSDAPILTWRGPPTRHVLKTVDVQRHIPGFTHYEETIESGGLPVDIYTVFSPFIYQGGAVLAMAPPVSSPNDTGAGFGNLALVLGAAFTTDSTGTEWLVCMAGVNKRLAGGGFEYRLYARSGGSNLLFDEDNPGGWQNLGVHAAPRPTACWFFNASGNEAQCIQGATWLKVNINITELTALFTEVPRDEVTQTYSFESNDTNLDTIEGAPPDSVYCKPAPAEAQAWNGAIQGHTGGSSLSLVESGSWIVGVDYKGDEEVFARVNHTVNYNAAIAGEARDTFKLSDMLGDFPGGPSLELSSWSESSGNPVTAQYLAHNMCVDHFTTTRGSITEGGTLTINCADRCFGPGEVGSVTVTVFDNVGNSYQLVHDVQDCGGHWETQTFNAVNPYIGECTCTVPAYCKCTGGRLGPIYQSPAIRWSTDTSGVQGVNFFSDGQLIVPGIFTPYLPTSDSCGGCDASILVWETWSYIIETWTCP